MRIQDILVWGMRKEENGLGSEKGESHTGCRVYYRRHVAMVTITVEFEYSVRYAIIMKKKLSNEHKIQQCVLCLGYELRLKKQFSVKDVKHSRLQSNRSTPVREINYWLALRIIKCPIKKGRGAPRKCYDGP